MQKYTLEMKYDVLSCINADRGARKPDERCFERIVWTEIDLNRRLSADLRPATTT